MTTQGGLPEGVKFTEEEQRAAQEVMVSDRQQKKFSLR